MHEKRLSPGTDAVHGHTVASAAPHPARTEGSKLSGKWKMTLLDLVMAMSWIIAA